MKKPIAKHTMKKPRHFVWSALMLSVLWACGDSDELNGPNTGPPKASEKPWDGPGQNPFVGLWGTGSNIVDFRFDTYTWTPYGGGATGTAYYFAEDGTYYFYIATTGYGLGSISGWVQTKGNYKIVKNQIHFYNIYASSNINGQLSPFEPSTNSEKAFEFIEDNNTGETTLKIQNSLSYADGSVGYDFLRKQLAKPAEAAPQSVSPQK